MPQYNVIVGTFEPISNVVIGTFVLDEWTNFKLDGNYPFLLSDIVIKQGAGIVAGSNYEIAIDNAATAQESGFSGKTLYGQIKITNPTFAGVELNVSGSNFGTYSSNQGTQDFVNAEISALTALTVPAIADLFLYGVPPWDSTLGYLLLVSFVQDEGIIWESTFGTIGVPNTNLKPSTNQDKWTPVSAPKVSVDIADAGTVVLQWADMEFVVDADLGDASILDNTAGLFDGQEVSFIVIGSGHVDIDGSAFGGYVNKQWVNNTTEKNYVARKIWSESQQLWDWGAEQTFEYIQTAIKYQFHSDGRMIISLKKSVTYNSNVRLSALVTLDKDFTANPRVLLAMDGDDYTGASEQFGVHPQYQLLTINSITPMLRRTPGSTPFSPGNQGSIDVEMKGYYA